MQSINPKVAFPYIQLDKDEAKTLKIWFRERTRQKRADKRLRLQLTIKINSKQFWALVNRSKRKKAVYQESRMNIFLLTRN